MDLLFRRQRTSESEPGTPAPLIYASAGRDNRDDHNPLGREEPEDQLETDSSDGSNGGQPESSPTIRKRGAPQGSQTSRSAKASTQAPQGPRDGQPELSATAAKWGAPQDAQTPRTLRTYGTAQLPVQRRLVLGPATAARWPARILCHSGETGGAPGGPNSPYAPNLRYGPNFPYSEG